VLVDLDECIEHDADEKGEPIETEAVRGRQPALELVRGDDMHGAVPRASRQC